MKGVKQEYWDSNYSLCPLTNSTFSAFQKYIKQQNNFSTPQKDPMKQYINKRKLQNSFTLSQYSITYSQLIKQESTKSQQNSQPFIMAHQNNRFVKTNPSQSRNTSNISIKSRIYDYNLIIQSNMQPYAKLKYDLNNLSHQIYPFAAQININNAHANNRVTTKQQEVKQQQIKQQPYFARLNQQLQESFEFNFNDNFFDNSPLKRQLKDSIQEFPQQQEFTNRQFSDKKLKKKQKQKSKTTQLQNSNSTKKNRNEKFKKKQKHIKPILSQRQPNQQSNQTLSLSGVELLNPVMKRCKCCGKLIQKLCFKCPHLYCNQQNCPRKKKKMLNDQMLEKLRQKKIQQFEKQRKQYQKMKRLKAQKSNQDKYDNYGIQKEQKQKGYQKSGIERKVQKKNGQTVDQNNPNNDRQQVIKTRSKQKKHQQYSISYQQCQQSSEQEFDQKLQQLSRDLFGSDIEQSSTGQDDQDQESVKKGYYQDKNKNKKVYDNKNRGIKTGSKNQKILKNQANASKKLNNKPHIIKQQVQLQIYDSQEQY